MLKSDFKEILVLPNEFSSLDGFSPMFSQTPSKLMGI